MARQMWRYALPVLVCASAPAAHAAGRLETRIEAASTQLTTVQDVNVHLTLANTGDASVWVLRWQTPVDGVQADLFEVARNGKLVDYLGPLYKRPAPTRQDWIEIKAGDSLAFDVELTALYDMAQPGEYTLRYRSGLQVGRTWVGIESDPATLWIDGRETSRAVIEALEREEPAEAAAAGPTPDYLTPVYVSCSSSRQSSTTSALSSAQTYSGNSLSYLNAGTAGPRYTTWFGSYTSSRYNTVKSNFSAIDSTIRTKTITFNCSCTSSAYAYVYPTQPYKIYLCNAFWSAPTTGTDSKAGTIIHELSHFNVVASTNDYAYGHSACKSLAISNPNNAVKNADSHEYFAENTPSQN